MRPSELYGVEHEIAAFCFDRAVTLFGQDVENEMHAAAQRAKTNEEAVQLQQSVLRHRISDTGKQSSGFRDPARVISF